MWNVRGFVEKVGVAALAIAAPVLALAEDVDPGIAAFDTLTAKVTSYGGMAFALAVVGTGIWIGIDLFKKGAKKGAK